MNSGSESSLYLSATSIYEEAADRGLPDPFDTHHSRTSLRSSQGLDDCDSDDSLEDANDKECERGTPKPDPSTLRHHADDVELLQNRLRHVHSQKAAMIKTMQQMYSDKKLVEVKLEAAQAEATQYKARAMTMEETISDISSRLSTMVEELEDTRQLLTDARHAATADVGKTKRRKSSDDPRPLLRWNKSPSLTAPGGLFNMSSAASTQSFDDLLNVAPTSNASQDGHADDDDCPRGRRSSRRCGRRPRRSRSLDLDDMGQAMAEVLAHNADNNGLFSPPVPSTLTLSVQKVLMTHQASSTSRTQGEEAMKHHQDSISTADITSYIHLNDFEGSNVDDTFGGRNCQDPDLCVSLADPAPTRHERPGSVLSLDRGDWIDNVVSKAFSVDAGDDEARAEQKIDDSYNGSLESLGLEKLPERQSSLNQAA